MVVRLVDILIVVVVIRVFGRSALFVDIVGSTVTVAQKTRTLRRNLIFITTSIRIRCLLILVLTSCNDALA
jgi:hypothetical protein